jgi:SAM-dependent methyltransferase
VQLGFTVPRETLFNNDYPYETGINSHGIEHFRELANTAFNMFHPKHVVDIGSNDGTLLKEFEKLGCNILGIEPVKSIANRAKVKTLPLFWNPDLALNLRPSEVVTACNVFAHVSDLHNFLKGVDNVLTPKGVLIVEAPYLYDMLNGLEYDTIYHEHLCYLSPKPLQYLLAMHNMVIFNMERLPYIHGGSMRYFIGREVEYLQNKISQENFTEMLLWEFEEKVETHREKLLDMLYKFRGDGKRIVGVSAPAKGNTLLNYCKIGTNLLDYITEKSELKIGKFTPGMHIPVVPDSRLIEKQPDYALLLAWNWKDQIKKALSGYKGKWIIPLPEPVIE